MMRARRMYKGERKQDKIDEEMEISHLMCADETTGLAFRMYGARGIRR
jgi:hypothetical protein